MYALVQKRPYQGQETRKYFPVLSHWHWQHCTEIQLDAPSHRENGKTEISCMEEQQMHFFHDGESFEKLSAPLNTVLDSAPLPTAIPAARSRGIGVVSCSYNTPGERTSFQAVETPVSSSVWTQAVSLKPQLSRLGFVCARQTRGYGRERLFCRVCPCHQL